MAKLGRMARDAGAAVGMRIHLFAVMPTLEDGDDAPNRVRTIYLLGEEFAQPDEFAELEKAMLAPSVDPQADAASRRALVEEAKMMDRKLMGGGGIL